MSSSMIALPDLLVFVAALAAVYLMPGPDMALVLSTSSFGGRKNGLMAALGLAISRTLHVTLSALGLAALFHTHPALFDGIRWLGSAYLLLLAWKVLGSDEAGEPIATLDAQRNWQTIQRGVMTNLLNPKALIFCAFLLPQFISTQQSLGPQYLALGTILVGLGLVFDTAYAFAASSLAKRFSRFSAARKATRLVFSGIFGFAAIRLAIGSN